MNDTVKRDNRKSLPGFLLVILVAGVLGGIAGFFTAMAADLGALDAIWVRLDQMMKTITPWAIPVCTAALLIPGFCLYRSAKKRYAAWDQESDEEYQIMEGQLKRYLLSDFHDPTDFAPTKGGGPNPGHEPGKAGQRL